MKGVRVKQLFLAVNQVADNAKLPGKQTMNCIRIGLLSDISREGFDIDLFLNISSSLGQGFLLVFSSTYIFSFPAVDSTRDQLRSIGRWIKKGRFRLCSIASRCHDYYHSPVSG